MEATQKATLQVVEASTSTSTTSISSSGSNSCLVTLLTAEKLSTVPALILVTVQPLPVSSSLAVHSSFIRERERQTDRQRERGPANYGDVRTLKQTRQTGGVLRSGTQIVGRSLNTRHRAGIADTDSRHRPEPETRGQ